MKNGVIIVLLLIVIWLSVVVIRLENFRYATQVGFCGDKPTVSLFAEDRYQCLKKVQTRTNSLAHLFFALAGDF
jgi:fluoride ion exporter CrcB/FEX